MNAISERVGEKNGEKALIKILRMIQREMNLMKGKPCHCIVLLTWMITSYRGGYRVRHVRQLTYFSFNRHNDMRL